MGKFLKLFKRTDTAAMETSPLPTREDFESLRAERDVLRGERDGYKNAYEIVNSELGTMRMTAAPWVRPPGHYIPNGPSIFVVTLPKSGTLFIGHTLRQTLGYDFTSTLVTPTPFKNLIWPTMAWDFMRGGMVSVSHLQPDQINIGALWTDGIRKGVLHIRDPRAAMLSWYHFVRATAKRQNGKIGLGDVGALVNPDILGASASEHIDKLIGSYFTRALEWISGWVTALHQKPELNFLVTTHEKLSFDPDAYFSEILKFYGIEAELKLLGRDENTHFRRGDNDEWRSVLTAEQIDRVNSMIPDELWDRFNWAK